MDGGAGCRGLARRGSSRSAGRLLRSQLRLERALADRGTAHRLAPVRGTGLRTGPGSAYIRVSHDRRCRCHPRAPRAPNPSVVDKVIPYQRRPRYGLRRVSLAGWSTSGSGRRCSPCRLGNARCLGQPLGVGAVDLNRRGRVALDQPDLAFGVPAAAQKPFDVHELGDAQPGAKLPAKGTKHPVAHVFHRRENRGVCRQHGVKLFTCHGSVFLW